LFVTRCGHQFHGTCMLNHITSSNTNNHCPSCRGHIL
jgi:DNA-directed RNA polymerase subunit RPC12/RpoP